MNSRKNYNSIFRVIRSLRLATKNFSGVKKCITTPIFYANDEPHIGHLYTIIYADAISKWERRCGSNVLFTTGTDEHGLKIQTTSRKLGIPEQSLCDRNSQKFKDLMGLFNIGYDTFIRTTNDAHKRTVQLVWKKIEEKNLIQKSCYEGWYSLGEESFISEKNLTKLPDGKLVTQSLGQEVEWVKEENHMFDISIFKESIEKALKPEHKLLEPAFYQETLIKDLADMKEISVSRPRSRISWGIPVPSDPNFSIYVWLDALINYLTVLGFPDKDNKEYNLIHVIGKDIVKFHSIYWIAFLTALDLPAPRKIIVHNHWLSEKKKMSKSLGNSVKPQTLLNKYPAESIRLYFLAEGPSEFDMNFDESELVKCYNDFIEGFSNLIQRVISPKILTANTIEETNWELDELDYEYISTLTKHACQAEKNLGSYNFRKAYIEIRKMWMVCNKQFNDWKPWSLSGDKERLLRNKRIYLTLEGIRIINELLSAINPEFSATLKKNVFNGREEAFKFQGKCTASVVYSVTPSGSKELLRKKLAL